MSLTNYELVSFHDGVEQVLDQVIGGDRSPRNLRQAKRAVREAYRELSQRRQWRYYFRRLKITTAASQTTGTIAYDDTGGAHERMMTLTGATWPADVEKYDVLISNVRYEIDQRISSTVITLSERANPGADIAAGTSYTLLRDTYELPFDVRQMDYLYDVMAPGRMVPKVDPDSVFREQRLVKTTAVPRMYTVMRTTKFASGLAIVFAPAPSAARTYDAVVQVRPLDLTTYDMVGTASTTATSTTVTGDATAWNSQHAGAVIRFSPTTNKQPPTSVYGELQDNRLNPCWMQRVVRSVESTTSLTLEQAADTTLANVGYRLSSRIDIEPGAMMTALWRLAEAMYSPNDRNGQEKRMAVAERAYQQAAWADQRMLETPNDAFVPHGLADMAASVTPTTLG